MIAELIITYALISNEPVLLRSPGPPYTRHEVALNVEKHWWEGFFLNLTPYVKGSEMGSVERAGAFAEVGFHFGDVTLSVYHHSSHNLDRPGDALEVDGVKLRWRIR